MIQGYLKTLMLIALNTEKNQKLVTALDQLLADKL